MSNNAITVERRIAARPETVFSFFTDRDEWLSWMGQDGEFSVEPGGAYRTRVTGEHVADGRFVEIDPPGVARARRASPGAVGGAVHPGAVRREEFPRSARTLHTRRAGPVPASTDRGHARIRDAAQRCGAGCVSAP
ncbi:SRPBCC family protein [Streptomyces sp. NPDC001450]